MITKIIEKLAKRIGYNAVYKTYYELSQSNELGFIHNFKNTKNYYLKFAIFVNPNIDTQTKRDLLGNDFDHALLRKGKIKIRI